MNIFIELLKSEVKNLAIFVNKGFEIENENNYVD